MNFGENNGLELASNHIFLPAGDAQRCDGEHAETEYRSCVFIGIHLHIATATLIL